MRQMLPVGLPAPLREVSNPVDDETLRVLGSGDVAFQQIVERVRNAERSVEIRAFLWRDDDAGNMLGEAVLAAADRGASVVIHKDKIAAVYEYTGGNKQSFFHKRVDAIRGFQAWFLGAVYRTSGSFKQRPNALSQRILEHPNIKVEHMRKRFDHSKVYIVDDRYLMLGSMGIGDNHRHDWVDIMVEAEGAEYVARLRERMAGHDEFDPSRGIDFLVHSRAAHRKKSCPMISHRLALIDAAQESITVEMAYFTDLRFSAALARAVQRGIKVKLVTAENADVLANINRATYNALFRLSEAAENLTVVLVPRMVHSKVVVIDHRWSDVGSANFTSLSHGVYDEINLYADNEAFARALEAEIESHCEDAKVADQSLRYRRVYSVTERAIIAYQSRRGG
ncbi:MAG: phosphatidylserine/phosphatidylglycerophosphate/cardiolipin synthase family protein [Deltaproteobacteria bacterium]|nr:phosphatidylserine/phosphatidylglycerophosphate/cardiolipin synthase family protein [Deltaproteobacteria bacterium]MCW5803386.1 phosphatidylserine/phosphatidylglycerophosphate/cardiolipin synthase family protein [Deltaproteobacteria bacterium]